MGRALQSKQTAKTACSNHNRAQRPTLRRPIPRALAHSLLSQPTSIASSISVPKREIYLGLAEEWAGCAGPRCSVLHRVGYAAANEQAALRVLGSRTQWPCRATAFRDRTGEDPGLVTGDLHCRRCRCARISLPPRGTRICEQFGKELRGIDLLSLSTTTTAMLTPRMLHSVFTDGAVGHGLFRAYTATNRQANFEIALMPLIHSGETINRLLGVITAIEPPFWLGAEPAAPRAHRDCICIGRTDPRAHDRRRKAPRDRASLAATLSRS